MMERGEDLWGRWRSLSDQEAAGETLNPEDAAFLRAYAEEDPRCADDLALFGSIAEHVEHGALPEMDDAFTTHAVLEHMRQADGRGRARWWVAGLGILAAAAAAALWIGSQDWDRVQVPAAVASTSDGSFVVYSGRVRAGDEELEAGSVVPVDVALQSTSAACVGQPQWGAACMEPDSTLTVVSDAGSGRHVVLDRGAVSVDLRSTGVVEAGGGTVEAEGTRFRVAHEEIEATVVVTAVAGSVRVAGPDGSHVGPPGAVVEVVLSRARGDTAPAPRNKATQPGPRELLERAQAAREAGRGQEALALYRKLTARHGRSPEAAVAWLSVGELELEQGRPAAAVRAFDRYLRRGGALARDARYQRIRALRRLGQRDAEANAIADFLNRHPNSLYADPLRRRGAGLRGSKAAP